MKRGKEMKGLKHALMLLAAAFALEFAGFFFSNSLSLLADSLFIFTEFLFFLVLLQGLKSIKIGAITVFFSLAILLTGLFIIYLVSYRFVFGSEVDGFTMLLFASLGLVMNTAAMRKARKRYKMEPRGLFLHVLRKTLPSIFLVSGALWILFTGEVFVDYIFGALIGLMVIFEALLLLRDSACLLLGERKSRTYLFKNVL